MGEEEEFGGRGRVKENILRTTANHDSMQVITVAGYSYVSCVDVSKCFICCDEDVSGSVLIINVIIAGRKEEGGWREGGGREGGWEEGGWEEGGGREGGGGWEDGKEGGRERGREGGGYKGKRGGEQVRLIEMRVNPN